MNPLLRHQAWLLLVAVLIFFTNLGNYALVNDDEPKNAVCGAEMFRRGDLIVPTFNEKLRTDKPILIYWFMFVSYATFGISEFSARFASSLLSVGTTLLTYHLGRKLYSAEVGFLAGLIICTSMLFSVAGRSATPDSFLIFFVTLAFTLYVWAVARQRGGKFSGDESDTDQVPAADSNANPTLPVDDSPAASGHPTPDRVLAPATWKLAAPFYAALGLAVLAKGPVGVLLPCSIILLFLLLSFRERDLADARLNAPEGPWWRRWYLLAIQLFRPLQILESVRAMHLGIGIGIVAAVALPWYLAVGFATNGDWLEGFLFDHNLRRALVAREKHNGFPLYMLFQFVTLHFGCFPWSVFLPVAAYQLSQRFSDGAPERDSDRLLTCWGFTWLIFFSIVSTRLPGYLLPMYPAVALILARYFYDWERDEVDSGVYSFNLCCRAMGIVGILSVIGVYIADFVLFGGLPWLSLIGAVPIIGALIAVKFLDREQRRRVLQTLVLSAFLLAFLSVAIAPPYVSRYQDSPKFIADIRRFAGGAAVDIGTYRYFKPSVTFYAGQKVTVLESTREVADFFASHPHAFVITFAAQHNALRDDLNSDVTELSRHRSFLRRDDLILLGRN